MVITLKNLEKEVIKTSVTGGEVVLTGQIRIPLDAVNPKTFVAFIASCYMKKLKEVAEERGISVEGMEADVRAKLDVDSIIVGVNSLGSLHITLRLPREVPEEIIEEAKRRCLAYATISKVVDTELEIQVLSKPK